VDIHLRFFEQDTLAAAEQLIGCYLARKIDGREIIVRITETEAYKGSEDPASHAYRGKTARNTPMFGRAGKLYVYLSYGLHYCMNVVTEAENVPGAVLLRAGKAVQGLDLIRERRGSMADKQLLNGPGKLAQALSIALDFNGYDLLQPANPQLAIHPRERAYPVAATPRIGISKAQEYPWRFILRDNG
jgi:DNA-3-methyladenine glycosylase